MKYCTRCLYPANHPLYLTFDDHGVCSGCRVHEEKDILNWEIRKKKLDKILESYRNKSGNFYDCVIPVRGGGDSYFVTHVITKIFKLNPLLVTYNHEYNTKTGIRNLANLLTVFDCDHINYTLDPEFVRRLVRHTFRKFASMYWHILAGTLTFPVQVAVKFKIPLIIWGVHGWSDQVGMFSHLDEVEMTEKARKEHGLMGIDARDIISEKDGVTRQDIQPFIYPFDEEIERVGVRGIYLSNYIRWDSKKQHERMIKLYGYETAKQQRTFNTYEDVDCFHSAGTHDYIKFIKYGYSKVSDHATREIRLKRMTREEGIEMVKKYSEKIPSDLPVFLKWSGIKRWKFFSYLDKWRDKRIWQKDKYGKWVLKDSVVNHIKDLNVSKVRLVKIEDCKFIITPSREPGEKEDKYILMGRGYIDKYNYKAVFDDQLAIQKNLKKTKRHISRLLEKDWGNFFIKDERTPKEMVFCKKCVMSSSKPGLYLNEDGICGACVSVEKKKLINWDKKKAELKQLCDKYRGSNGNGYDCLVPVSGGKDSMYQVWEMKKIYNMKVLAVCIVPHLQTSEGIANLNSLVKKLNVDLIKISLKPSVFKAIRRKTFVKLGNPNWADHASTFSGVARTAFMYQIPLIVWGEDIAVEFGGTTSKKRVASAKDIIKNDLILNRSVKDFYDDIIKPENTYFYKYPQDEDWDKRKIKSIYLGYYHNWNGYEHYLLAKKYGFQSRKLGCLSGNILNYDNIDEKLCEIHIWIKFLKYGFWRPTDQCCYHIWNGRMSREKAIRLVNAKQYEFPAEYYRDFLEFHGITEKQFWKIANKYRNRNIWHKVNGKWKLKYILK